MRLTVCSDNSCAGAEEKILAERGARMLVRDYELNLRRLTEQVHMKPSDLVLVDNVAQWCKEHGVTENDGRKPLKLIPGNGDGPRMLIAAIIPDEILEERIRAVQIRNQLENVAYDRADLLNSDIKKAAYLFLKEYAANVPDLADDELASDDWVFERMEKLGMFNS